MTRLEQEQPRQAYDHDEIKRQVREEVRAEGKRRACMGLAVSLGILFLVLAAPAVFVGYIAAKSGFVDVPIMTDLVYKPAEPVRVVSALSMATNQTVVNSAVARANVNRVTGTASVSFTEEEVTTLLESALAEAQAEKPLPLPVTSIQMAFEDGKFELFGTVEREGGEIPILIRAVPAITDGRLTLDSDEFKVGALTIPDSLADLMLKNTMSGLLDGLSSGLGDAGTLSEVEVREGRVILHLQKN